MTSAIWALIPFKAFGTAKSRLAEHLAIAERRELAQHLFDRILGAAFESEALERVFVVTAAPEVAERATKRGAEALSDPEEAEDLASVVNATLDHLARRGGRRALVLMGDLPNANAAALSRFVEGAGPESLRLCPNQHGDGTNALLLPLPRPIATAFGEERSGALHREAASAMGLLVEVRTLPELAFDVDTPEDLRSL